jgi:general secretion pathway protein J
MRAQHAAASKARLGGFTLVEILVVMSLLSVIMLALGSALRTLAQAEERIDIRLDRADEMRIASTFLRSTLARVSARKVKPPPPATEAVLFATGPNAVAWVGVMPARYGAGGRSFFRLALEPDGAESALVIRFAPWTAAPDFPDWSRAESRILVRHVTSVALRFQDAQSSPPQWSADWSPKDRLPDQLQLEIETAQGGWPPLTFPMRAMPTGNPSLGGAAFGAS